MRSSSLLGVHCRFGRFFASVGRDGEPRRGALFFPISEALHGHHHRPEVVGGRCSCAQAPLGGKGLGLADREEGRCRGLVRYVPFCRSRQRRKSRLGQLVRAAKQGKTWLAGQARPPEELMAGKKAETSTSGSENWGYAVANLTRLKLDAVGIVISDDC